MLLRRVKREAANESVRLIIGVANWDMAGPDWLGTIPVNAPSAICSTKGKTSLVFLKGTILLASVWFRW